MLLNENQECYTKQIGLGEERTLKDIASKMDFGSKQKQ